MKKTLTVILLIVLAFPIAGQVIDSSKYQVQQELLRKSKNQKILGFIALGGGVLAAGVGLILYEESGSLSGTFTGEGLLIGGGVAMVASVPFFIASGNNKRKAISMSTAIKTERINPDCVFRTRLQYYPAISLKFDLN